MSEQNEPRGNASESNQGSGHTAEPSHSFDDLVRIIGILRKECPWDRKQTHESIKDLMIEEIYEAVDAIDRKDFEDLKKELGDLMLHVVFNAVMAGEKQHFDIGDVIYTIQDKLIRRHPHVFENVEAGDSDEVLRNWESIKMAEGERQSVLQGVPGNLPALLRAQRMQEKAGAVGFDWKEWNKAWPKLQEELEEFRQAAGEQDPDASAREFGDLLFALVNVGRLLNLDAEDCLRMTNNKFQRRFEFIEKRLAEQDLTPSQVTLEQMDELWDEAKNGE